MKFIKSFLIIVFGTLVSQFLWKYNLVEILFIVWPGVIFFIVEIWKENKSSQWKGNYKLTK